MNRQDYRILIVDDEPANVYLLARMLRDSYRVVEARSGEDALAIAHGPDKPVLILLDVMMPEIDGFEVCRRLKADDETKDIIVIFVTAIGDSAAEEIGLNLGAADYITKPISLPIVRARVRNQINMRQKADMLEAMSYIDGLTHVYNRRKFDTMLHKEWQRARNGGRPLALIMIDFDHFKALNDHYGHGAGDVCLQQGAAALSNALKRQGDLLARYGGEEFVALLPDTDLEGAQITADAMREGVKELKLEHKYSPVADHVTVSLGVAAMMADDQHQATHLLELADRALNRAKQAGRDRVVLMDNGIEAEVDAQLSEEQVSVPQRCDDALAKTEPSAALQAEATQVEADQLQEETAAEASRQALMRERRRYDAVIPKYGDDLPKPQPDKVLHALGELYRLPLSAELHVLLDGVFDAASDLVARLQVDTAPTSAMTAPIAASTQPEVTATVDGDQAELDSGPGPAAAAHRDVGGQQSSKAGHLRRLLEGLAHTQAATHEDTAGSAFGAISSDARFDMGELMRRLGDDREIAEATIEQFLTDVPSRLQELREAQQSQDMETIRFKAHSLKGLAGAVSAARLQRLSEQLEQSSSELATATELVGHIEQEYAVLQPLLQAELTA